MSSVLLESFSAHEIFISSAQQQSQLESFTQSALEKGIELYQQEDYEGAIAAFKRCIGIAPRSSYASDVRNYIANSYLHLEDTENAIATYKEAMRMDPSRDDVHTKLGNIYYGLKRYKEAEDEYAKAVRLNPSANNYYSLGQANINTGNFGEAEIHFKKVLQLIPNKPNGHFGLGLLYGKQERFSEAVEQFSEAINQDEEFYDAYAELGYLYADMGELDKAEEQLQILKEKEPYIANILNSYIYRKESPKIILALATGTFQYLMPIKTKVSALDAYLEQANASKSFTMVFQFDKQMDRASVENPYNWMISRAVRERPAESYNLGLPIKSNEVTMLPYPENVYYDASTLTATIRFTIRQNDTANGTIDPSHIEFKFSGKDIFGNAMDADYDQFTGFSNLV
ncbi:MAG: tetratricopeptide repeat protein [bacterium]